MTTLLTAERRSRKQTGSRNSTRRPTPVRLELEELETRQCPSPLDLGTLTADPESAGAPASVEYAAPPTDAPPLISNFTASNVGGSMWTFSGQVSDDQSVNGLVVALGGIPSLQGVTVTTNSAGWFSYSVQLGVNESGTATAQTKSLDGVWSNVAWTIVN